MPPPVQQPDPWAEAAKNYKPQAASGNAPSSTAPNDDWKLWQQNGAAAPPQQAGWRTAIDKAAAPISREEQAGHDPLTNAANAVGSGLTGAFLSPIAHPWETAKGLGKTIFSLSQPGGVLPNGENPVGDMGASIVKDYKENGPLEATSRLAGQLGGGYLTGEAGGELAGAALKPFAGPLERSGLSLGNNALGAKGPKPFKYDTNPARGAYESGVLPAMSKHSAAMNVEEALPVAGQNVSDAVMRGGTAPLSDIASSIENPLNEARGIIRGPGGGNRSVEPLDALQVSMARRAPGASQPIYGHGAGTPFTPDETVAAMGRTSQKALPAPLNEIQLHNAPDITGTPSKPITLTQPMRPSRLALSPPTVDTPLTENPFHGRVPPNEGVENAPISASRVGEPFATPEGNPNYGYSDKFPSAEGKWTGGALRRPSGIAEGPVSGMSQAEYIGEIPGERGGPGQPQGTLIRPQSFSVSSEPSPFTNLRHPVASAPDLWRTIQNIDRNTRFNPDPEVEGVNELRRDIRGGLRGNLEEAVPGLKPLSQRYGDLKGVQESLEKTMHSGGGGIGKMAQVPMFPIETTVGKGLYSASKLMRAARSDPFAAAGTVSPLTYRRSQ